MSAALSGTKIDSAARHNVVARVCESFMSQFRLAEEIQNNKHAYCCKKNELLLGIGRPFNSESGVSVAEDKAYLPVISNVGIFSTPGQVRAASWSSWKTAGHVHLPRVRPLPGAAAALPTPAHVPGHRPQQPLPSLTPCTCTASAHFQAQRRPCPPQPHAVHLRAGRHRPTAVVR